MPQELVDLLVKFDVAVPRYTSYPTAPIWTPFDSTSYEERLGLLGNTESSCALYVHIPFCHTMCLFCACSVVLNRKPENEERYVAYLCKEIALVASRIGRKKRVCQLHFGGGTPTKLTTDLLGQILETIREHFIVEPDAEIAIEIDPRTVFSDDGKKLSWLKEAGFNRVSFGVQDTNAEVQEAIRRRQSLEMTSYTYALAKELGFSGINLDLIYGLPKQTVQSFAETIQNICALRPDRLALFSYAKVPWIKEHQKAIKDEWLASTRDKFRMYAVARRELVASGYRAIGMDHFAQAEDSLARAYDNKCLQRNFQGYTVLAVDDLIGFGMTAIGFVSGCYVQNAKELSGYMQALDSNRFACSRGHILGEDDHIRRYVIQRLMCDFRLDKRQFLDRFGIAFDSYFAKEKPSLQELVAEGLVEDSLECISATEFGELFIRNIASCFDHYLPTHAGFSRGV